MMNSAIPTTCMDRYINRYIVPPHQIQHHHQQLLSQQQQSGQSGFYAHQLLQQQPQQQQQQQQPQVVQQPQHQQPLHNFMVGCYNNANGWTGVPLISTASRRPRKFQTVNQNIPIGAYQSTAAATSKVDFDENAMSRLALHAHGAPLILASNRYRSNNKTGNSKQNKPGPINHHVAATRDDYYQKNQTNGGSVLQQQHPQESVVGDDSGLSSGITNSSSCSSSSDTCLPRIIKPRKRRKKDRKPNATAAVAGQTTAGPNGGPYGSMEPMAPVLPQNSNGQQQVLLDDSTRDFLHEIALIANAGGTFDFPGFPLIRDQQQLHNLQHQQQQLHQQQQQPATVLGQQHFSSSNSDSSDSGINNLACSCRLCDPFGKIWAFPLRRSCSDNSAEIELNRVKDVGVIGSNRSNSFRSEWRSAPHCLDQQPQQHQAQQQQSQEFGAGSSRKGSFSDSGDSGCDLLSGLTFCSEDILGSVNRELFLTPVDGGKEFQFPTSSGVGVGLGNNSISGSCGSPGSANSGEDSDNSAELLLMSELSKKLNEGLDLGGSSSCSDAAESVVSAVNADASVPPNLFVNFDAISRNNLFSVNNISKLSNLLFDDSLMAPGLVINNSGGGVCQKNSTNNPINNTNDNVVVLGNNGNGVNYIRNKSHQSAASTGTSSLLFGADHQPFVLPFVSQQQQQQPHSDIVWSNNNANRKPLPVEK
ncbi:mushroom body large-type Kenyon cell-specific protein 1-like [Uranotaenia lowii]|uniref:mushroom body large-type Kenyon cell-specific protein 1-like n=1 Tax=Uranotaenia lowii TaxID=190385 RepID=UPI00247834E7|nr:mushroom body large-type Kenyon cell-specific protein 1-like [Uranotaenia lowii]